ncbi:hypothetical protein [Spirosoma aerophilum]
MKTFKFALLLAFLASPIFIFSNFRPKKDQPVQASIQGDETQNRLQVALVKPPNTPVTLRVLDSDGCLLHEESILDGSSSVQAQFNLWGIPNGTYRVEVCDPKRSQTHLIQLASTKYPTLKRQIIIQPAE